LLEYYFQSKNFEKFFENARRPSDSASAGESSTALKNACQMFVCEIKDLTNVYNEVPQFREDKIWQSMPGDERRAKNALCTNVDAGGFTEQEWATEGNNCPTCNTALIMAKLTAKYNNIQAQVGACRQVAEEIAEPPTLATHAPDRNPSRIPSSGNEGNSIGSVDARSAQ
jgi:hypothetical protein